MLYNKYLVRIKKCEVLESLPPCVWILILTTKKVFFSPASLANESTGIRRGTRDSTIAS